MYIFKVIFYSKLYILSHIRLEVYFLFIIIAIYHIHVIFCRFEKLFQDVESPRKYRNENNTHTWLPSVVGFLVFIHVLLK